MPETQVREIGRQDVRRGAGVGRVVVRIAAASVIFIGMLGAASPSWAGPLMGC